MSITEKVFILLGVLGGASVATSAGLVVFLFWQGRKQRRRQSGRGGFGGRWPS